MRIMGLDLGLTAPGIAPPGLPPFTVHTDAKTGDKRLCHIRDVLEYYVLNTRPQLAVIEAVPPYDHASSVLSGIHYIAREVLARADVPFVYVNVHALKAFATGDGNADKAAMVSAAEAWSGTAMPDDNAADAWMLRKMGETWAGGRLVRAAVAQTAHVLQAMSSVDWPLRPGDPEWPRPYGTVVRSKAVTKKCRHRIVSLKNGDHWLHPFTMARCDKPPK